MSYIQSDDYHSAPSVRLFQCTRKETTSKLSVFLSSSEMGARTTEEGDGANTPKPLSRKKDKLVIILTGNIQCLVERYKILRKKLSEFHPKIKKHRAFMAGSLLRNVFLTLQNIELLSCIISFTSWCCVQVKWENAHVPLFHKSKVATIQLNNCDNRCKWQSVLAITT